MSAPSAPLPAARAARGRLFGHVGFALGAGVVALILLVALFAPWIAPHDPYAQDLLNRLTDPVWHRGGSWEHPLGTDAVGRDYLSRLIYGARISLLIGFCAALMAALIGGVLGVAAGYFGGRVDQLVMLLVNVRLALPVVLVALAVVAVVGGSLTVVVIVLGCLLWDQMALVARAATMQARSMEYVAAAQAAGSSTFRVLTREVLPNVANPLIVVLTIEMANAILIEAALSFLGLGVQAPLPSWGLMLSEAKAQMFFQPWLIALPGACIGILVLAINLAGDGLRDLTQPEGRI
jgi:peptide/nickel transport system permease protein